MTALGERAWRIQNAGTSVGSADASCVDQVIAGSALRSRSAEIPDMTASRATAGWLRVASQGSVVLLAPAL
jgi:hypothetical protein